MATEFAKIFEVLKKSGYKIFGPKYQDRELHILELEAAPSAENLSRASDRSWKYFFTPPREMILKFGKKVEMPKFSEEKKALFGMSFFDCKALELYDKVFGASPFGKGGQEGDLYYQQNRKNIFIVGYSPVPLAKVKTIFFEPNLESAVFDIFIAPPLSSRATPSGAEGESRDLIFYARGKRAEKILKSAGLKYAVMPYKKHEPDKKVLAIMKAMEAGKDSKIWDELGEICLACGKCTIACPTCYCFDMESFIGPDCKTERCSGNCFYDDFTRIAGGHKFLNNPAEKIFFWYYHKFVRIPFGYGLPGCVDCGRCTAVCPVGIDIKRNIERLLKKSRKNGK